MGAVEPTPERLQDFLKAPEATPLVMINLLRYRERAAYPPGSEAEPCSGREAYQRYAELALRTVAEAGGRPVWLGEVASTLIAPAGEAWDDAVLVEYPSRKAFLDMIARPDYQAASVHRSAALADSRLVATCSRLDRLGG